MRSIQIGFSRWRIGLVSRDDLPSRSLDPPGQEGDAPAAILVWRAKLAVTLP